MLKIQRLWGKGLQVNHPQETKLNCINPRKSGSVLHGGQQIEIGSHEVQTRDKEVAEEQIIAGPKLERQINKVYARGPGLKAAEICLLSPRGNVVFQAHHGSVTQKICVLILFLTHRLGKCR